MMIAVIRRKRQLYPLVLEEHDLASAAVDRDAGLHDDPAFAALRIWMLNDSKAADDAPSVQDAVVQPVMGQEVVLLDGKIARGHVLAREIPVALRADAAARRAGFIARFA